MKKVAKIIGAGAAWAAIGVTSVFAQTATSTPTTPGVPNTGAGGDAMTNLLLLGISAAIMVVGLAYMARAKAAK